VPTTPLFDKSGSEAGTIDLPDALFAAPINSALMHQAVVAQLAGRRIGTAATKTRGMVRGGGKKPYRQKGTGRARQGSRSAPHYAGGGVVFGPTPRSYEQRLPKRMKRSALVSALTSKFDDGAIMVVNDLALDEIKTRQLAGHLAALRAAGRILLVEDGKNERLELSARNLPKVTVIRSDSLNIVDVLSADAIVITAPSIPTMAEVYA
jgi:large subunit ribosomal protein L4